MGTDRVFLEVLKHRVQSIAEEMASVVARTGYTVFVKETQDFATALASCAGEVFAAPVNIGTTLGIGRPVHRAVSAVDDLEPGDIIITNDPYSTNGMSTHLTDIFLIRPIFVDGRCLCHALAFIHSSDVGGKVPGSISPTSYDIFQEGLRIPPLKLFRAGALNKDIVSLLLRNCRIPDQNWGDLRALLAALQIAQERVAELVGRYGSAALENGISDLLDYAEAQARELIRAIPDGVYESWDYLEADTGRQEMIRIRARMEVKEDRIEVDFSGTAHQVRAAFNLPTCGEKRHYQLVNSFVRFFRTLRPDIPFNSGLVRPICCHAPVGSLLNPVEPAATGVRAATMCRVLDVTMATLAQAAPDMIPSAGAGQGCIVLLMTPDAAAGKIKVGVVQPLVGGSGARPTKDGIDGIDFHNGFTVNIPTEVLETDMPVLVERYGLRPGSGGAGRYRGGCGSELFVRIFTPDTVMTARGMERQLFRPWGRLGGRPGTLFEVALRRAGGEPVQLGKIDELLLQPGDVVEFMTPGGGGYGDPLERDPARVLFDVEAELVSERAALADYGVVMHDGRVDGHATQLERAARVRHVDEFDIGEERETYERRWPDKLQTLIIQSLAQYPVPMRGFLRAQLVERLHSREGGGVDSRAQVDEVLHDLVRSTELRFSP
ncbi:MAG TPA: hydantoinase B/oxoprolinase family protein [bacterium]|nr:hydantoinase B/oxoprolinase family protein [bacterium]